MYIRRSNIFQSLVILIVVVIIHKDTDLMLKFQGTVIIFQKNNIRNVATIDIGPLPGIFSYEYGLVAILDGMISHGITAGTSADDEDIK